MAILGSLKYAIGGVPSPILLVDGVLGKISLTVNFSNISAGVPVGEPQYNDSKGSAHPRDHAGSLNLAELVAH